MRKQSYIIILFACVIIEAKADEGMWIPMLLHKYNEVGMQQKGLKLSAGDIYSVNQSSLKDAVVQFGGGCTGEIVSPEGLLLTNHHCGYSKIQAHSTVEHDYLTNGFWAKTHQEELPNPGLTVSILVRMEDVTNRVLKDVTSKMTETEREKVINQVIEKIEKEATDTNYYNAEVKPLFYGNQYYLYVTEVFKDIRLVGAPPSAIGKFGGDTDNWMWPRHTGDFSVFRIYVDSANKPADYSKNNMPYKPKNYLEISLKGVNEDDFTMVYGYPYITEEYLPSFAIKMISDSENPARIKIRRKKLDIINADMNTNNKIRIQYSSKYAGIANGWKKWIGQNNGLKQLDGIEKKQEFEKQFIYWTNESAERKEKYGNLLTEYERLYKQYTPLNLWLIYFQEIILRSDMLKYASQYQDLIYLNKDSTDEIEKEIEKLKKSSISFFKDYNEVTEKKLFAATMKIFYDDINKSNHPEIMDVVVKKFKGDFKSYTDYIFEKSFMTSEEKVNLFLNNYKNKRIINDPVYKIMDSFYDYYTNNYSSIINNISIKIDSLNRLYMSGIMEMLQEKILYPDANATLRISYGKVEGYSPNDAIQYRYYTTLEGIIQKDNPDIYDYKVPSRLKELYDEKNYGEYGNNENMPVCFIASNHTTGGSSGSPVLNSEGQLVGINFDRNWEGTMSDIMYDVNQCRNISLDIRYCLFIIDKFAGARNLIDEMTIIK